MSTGLLAKCLNKKVNNLQSQVGTLNAQVQSLNGQVGTLNGVIDCIRTAPVTSYYGYEYTNVTSFLVTALDFTASGGPG